jgi:hypothetical protein
MAERKLPILCFLVGLPWLIAAFFPPLNHDSAAVLTWAQRMVAGERLYIDLIDVNPPMIFWLNLPPAAVASWTGISAAVLLVFWYALLTAVGLALALPSLTRRVSPGENLGVIAAAVGALLVLPAHSFTQREHLLLALALPYLIHAVGRAQGEADRKAWITAALFAVAVCLKPHFLLIPAGIEGFLIVQRGLKASLRDPTVPIMAGVGLMYLLAVKLITPAYFSAILPMMAELYTGAGADWPALLFGDQIPPLAFGCLLLGGLTWRHGVAPRLLLVFTVTASLAGLSQMKGWDYHFVAARGGLLLLVGWSVGHWLHTPGRAMGATLAAAIAYASLLAPPFAPQRSFAASPAARLRALMEQTAPGGSVLWFTTSLKPQFSILQTTGGQYRGHYMSLWPLPELYPPDGPPGLRPLASLSGIERDLIATTAADLARKPDLLVVTDGASEPGFGARAWDHLAYFRRDPRIAAALMAYAPVGTIDGWTLYHRH